MSHYDLIIVGGGLVGAGLAVALRDLPIKIALVDARLPTSDDPRLFGLNITSCQFLENLGIWPELAPHAAAIHQVQVSSQGQFGAVRLNREDAHLPALGYVIPAYQIESALNACLTTCSQLTIYRPARLTALLQQGEMAACRVTTEQGDLSLSAPLVIGADGTDSTVRRLLGIETDIHEYGQSALVTRTQLTRSHHHIAYERFTQNGAIAMLPLMGQTCATIWTSETTHIAALMALSDHDFLAELQSTFGYRLGRLTGLAKRHVFPLRMVKAKKAVAGQVYLLGNSLHTLHPIAAQGFNLAIYEVAMLVEALTDSVQKQQSLSVNQLTSMHEAINQQQTASIGITHRLTQLFSNDSIMPPIAIQMGMIGLNTIKPLKKRFINTLLGKSNHLPSLLMS